MFVLSLVVEKMKEKEISRIWNFNLVCYYSKNTENLFLIRKEREEVETSLISLHFISF
jgi:hypothetical protein